MFTLSWQINVPSANAQTYPQLFKGKVVLDGRPAPDGTWVGAYIDGIRIRSVRTGGGRFELEVRQESSMAGKTVQFIGKTVNGRELRFSQNARLQPGVETAMDLEIRGNTSFPFAEQEASHVFQGPVVLNGRPTSDGTRVWANLNQVRVMGVRTKAGRFQLTVRQPVSNTGKEVEIWVSADRLSLRVPQTWPWQPGGFSNVTVQFGGDAPVDASAQLEQERKRLEQEQTLQQEQQALDKQRLEAERALQEEQARNEQERLKRDRAMQEEQARLEEERLQRDRDRLRREELLDQERIQQEQERQRALDQARFDQEQQRLKQERELDQQQQELDEERRARQRQQEDRDFKAEQERLRRDVELNLQRQKFELEQRTRQELGLPALPPEQAPPPGEGRPIVLVETEEKGPNRGFFSNTAVGGLGIANDLLDPTMLAVMGIVLTLGASMLQMIRGD